MGSYKFKRYKAKSYMLYYWLYHTILYHDDQYHKIKTNAEREKYGNHNMNIIIYIQSDIIVNVHSYFYMSLRAHGGGIPKCCRFGGEGLHRGLAPCTAKVSNIASSELLQNNTRLHEIQNNSWNIFCRSLLWIFFFILYFNTPKALNEVHGNLRTKG